MAAGDGTGGGDGVDDGPGLAAGDEAEGAGGLAGGRWGVVVGAVGGDAIRNDKLKMTNDKSDHPLICHSSLVHMSLQ